MHVLPVCFAFFNSTPQFTISISVSILLLFSEFATNIHRDTLASHIGHHDHLVYLATAQNQSIGRVRLELYEVREKLL
jgi:hypothetical protein